MYSTALLYTLTDYNKPIIKLSISILSCPHVDTTGCWSCNPNWWVNTSTMGKQPQQ